MTLKRTLAISDIHGYADAFEILLKASKFNQYKDQLIMLGDYSGNGGKNHETFQIVHKHVESGAIALIGNHEQRLIDHHKKDDLHLHEWNSFLSQLHYWFENDCYLFVHAGVRPGISLEKQNVSDMISIRETFHHSCFTHFNKTIIFGHTPPTYRLGARIGELWEKENKIGIDTGANHGHYLSLVDLTNRTQYKIHVKERTPIKIDF